MDRSTHGPEPHKNIADRINAITDDSAQLDSSLEKILAALRKAKSGVFEFSVLYFPIH